MKVPAVKQERIAAEDVLLSSSDRYWDPLECISDVRCTRLMASSLKWACTSEPASPHVNIVRESREYVAGNELRYLFSFRSTASARCFPAWRAAFCRLKVAERVDGGNVEYKHLILASGMVVEEGLGFRCYAHSCVAVCVWEGGGGGWVNLSDPVIATQSSRVIITK